MELSGLVIQIIFILALVGGVGFTVVNLPGNLLIFLLALGYGYYEKFAHIDQGLLIVLFILLIVGELVEFAAGALGAKKENASKRTLFAAVLGAISGGVLGTAVVPLLGSFLGAVLGAFAAGYFSEYSKTGDAKQAKRVAKSIAVAQMLGTLFKFVIAVGMIIMIIVKLPWS